ncbi:Receptor-like protein [Zancudomyces culisetae]|uniref:Receptor-like protein n=1 Tax=Zancudomyces culisetae TaxID=1213189 RepID=A0A1R1PV94_ZANCU|nr:Receptor-like protein [Zancudomyces culisetae]OMH84876.1 Receptor-like protein [Zancudomyces culisetae]|eukprot:OMH79709.1 Receptor-like protein [Zancudomyces culisetae]
MFEAKACTLGTNNRDLKPKHTTLSPSDLKYLEKKELTPEDVIGVKENIRHSDANGTSSPSNTVSTAASYQHNRKLPLCSICIDDITIGAEIRKLPCGHIFHQECIESWLLLKSCVCPTCGYNVKEVLMLKADQNDAHFEKTPLKMSQIGLVTTEKKSLFTKIMTKLGCQAGENLQPLSPNNSGLSNITSNMRKKTRIEYIDTDFAPHDANIAKKSARAATSFECEYYNMYK